MTWMHSLWNICRTIWLLHLISICIGHHLVSDMYVKNHWHAFEEVSNCFVSNSTHWTMVGCKNRERERENNKTACSSGFLQNLKNKISWHFSDFPDSLVKLPDFRGYAGRFKYVIWTKFLQKFVGRNFKLILESKYRWFKKIFLTILSFSLRLPDFSLIFKIP